MYKWLYNVLDIAYLSNKIQNRQFYNGNGNEEYIFSFLNSKKITIG